MSDPKSVSTTQPLRTLLEPGTYRAVLVEYGGNTYNNKYGFKLVVDVDYGGDHPVRLWHFINPRYIPNIIIANVAGWIAGDVYLQRLTPEILQHNPTLSNSLGRAWCSVQLTISKLFPDRNDIVGIWPPVEIEATEVVNTPIVTPADVLKPEDDVPFMFDEEAATPKKPVLEPLGFDPTNKDEQPF